MQLHLIESDKIYKEILETPIEKRDELFKQKLLVPFINKFPTNTKLYKLMTTKPGEGN